MTFNKTQQKCIEAMRDSSTLPNKDECIEAFTALCEKHGRKWRSVLFDQFMHDNDVCYLSESHRCYIRQIRNYGSDKVWKALGM